LSHLRLQRIAQMVEDFLNIVNAEIKIKNNDKLDAKIELEGDIPEDGSGGAIGYGILTTEDAVIVTKAQRPDVFTYGPGFT
jgi:hypothetical protein